MRLDRLRWLVPLWPAAPPLQVESADWLLAQSRARFTLQLASVRDATRIPVFIRGHQINGQLAAFRAIKRGLEWNVLVKGVYPDRGAAEAAAAKLQKERGLKLGLERLRCSH